MLHSRRLRYIDEIARSGSIRKAANRLNVASSSINRQILAIEEEIGSPIFERLPRGLRLTAVGELFVEHIRSVLKDYERLQTRVSGLKLPQMGQVSIVTTTGLCAGPLADVMAKFLDQHPRTKLFVSHDGPGQLINPVLTGEVDLGLGFNMPATPGIRALASFEVPLGAVVSPMHALADKKEVSLSQISMSPMVLPSADSSLRRVINLALSPLNTPIQSVLETSSQEMIKKLVKSGTGISFMNPLDVFNDCRDGELVYLSLSDQHIAKQPMKLITRSRAQLDATTNMFVEYFIDELSQILGELDLL